MMAKQLNAIVGFLFSVAALASVATAAVETNRPNIIVILADDLGYGDVHCLNPQRGKIPTPNLDRLARQGMMFTDMHSASALCSPSRYALLTGRYAWRTHLRRGTVPIGSKALIAKDRLTLPGMLRQTGYTTACIGKWHLGGFNWPVGKDGTPDFASPIVASPITRGFDYYFGQDNYCQPPYCLVRNDRCVELPTATMMSTEEQVRKYKTPGYCVGPMSPSYSFESVLPTISQEAINYVAERAREKKPFFLYYAINAPHFPVAPSKEWQGKSGISPLADFVMQADGVIGDLLAALDKHGLANNTLVIFTADNGANDFCDLRELFKAGHKPSGPYRGYKYDIWEGGHREPFIARWPGKVTPGTTCNDLLCLSDLMATCADITGAQLPDNAAEDSGSFLPNLLGTAPGPIRKAIVHQGGSGVLSIRESNWKLVATPQFQLYDLSTDIRERTNVAAKHPGIVKRLAALLQRYIADGRSTPGAVQKNDVPVPLQQKDPPIRSGSMYQRNNPNYESLADQP